METEAITTTQVISANSLAFWSTVAAAISALLAAIAAAISFWQARVFRKQIEADAHFRKIQHTIEMNPHYAGTLDQKTAKMSCRDGFFWMMEIFGDRLKKMEAVSGSHLLIKLYDEWK